VTSWLTLGGHGQVPASLPPYGAWPRTERGGGLSGRRRSSARQDGRKRISELVAWREQASMVRGAKGELGLLVDGVLRG